MKIAILDAATLGADIDLSPIAALGETEIRETTPPELVAKALEGKNVAVLNKIKLGEKNLSGAKDLKLICVAATGYDNIDVPWCAAHGIAVANVPGYSTPSVCQLTLSMALYLTTHLGVYRDWVHSGAYSASGTANRLTPPYHEIASMTWGVVGGGAIGTSVARAAEAMGARVLMCRRKNEGDYPLRDIDSLLKESDIVSLHVPLGDSTRGMIDKRRLRLMKDGAILINAARGAVTDEAAVAEALLSGKLGGFGCDVYSAEPFGKDHPFQALLGLENVCLTPHMAWGSVEARRRCVMTMAENIRAFFEGRGLNRVDL